LVNIAIFLFYSINLKVSFSPTFETRLNVVNYIVGIYGFLNPPLIIEPGAPYFKAKK
jgi:hypothetical protein